MAGPRVTVGMSVHNAEATLALALRSVLWQSFADWELILIDDGSTDRTMDVVRQFQDPRIRVLYESRNKGLAVRLNQCLELARGMYFARMDADDVAYPERLGRQVSYLEAHPEVDLLGHTALVFHGDGQAIGLHPAAADHDEICRRRWWGFPLAHPTWMGRLEWFRRHRYRESAVKAQDQELLLRSFRTSRFATLQDVLLGYRLEGVSSTKSALGRYHYCRTLVEQICDMASAAVAVRGLAVHMLGLARDVLLANVGVAGGRQDRSWRSILPADAATLQQWQSLWSTLTTMNRPVAEDRTPKTVARL